MCKLSFIHLVNENSSILSLLLLISSIFFVTVYVDSQLDIFYVGSTHLQGFLGLESRVVHTSTYILLYLTLLYFLHISFYKIHFGNLAL
jgi:hypothetical protein